MAIKPINTDSELIGVGINHRENVKRLNENFAELVALGGGGNVEVNVGWDDVEDKPVVMAVGATQAEARAAIGAGTGNSNLAIGPTATDAKAGNYVPAWGDITSKPATFAPATHSHAWADVTGKPATFPATIGVGASDAKAGNYVPAWGDITSKPTLLTIGTSGTTAKVGNYVPDWSEITNKPTTFAPIVGTTAVTAAAGNHTHGAASGSAAGFMTAAHFTKLEGIAASANNYTLPAATSSVRGGINQGVAVVDATTETVVDAINALLASLRAAGVIAT